MQQIDEFIDNSIRVKKKSRRVKQETQTDALIGPDVIKRPKLDIVEVILENLPCADLYERSYMHKENLIIVLASSKSNYIITVSIDGHVKLWRKIFRLIDFAKHFRAHTGIVTCAALNINHDQLATVSPADKTVKIFDVLNTDLLHMVKLQFQPLACEFVVLNDVKLSILYISDSNSGDISILDESIEEKEKITKVIKIHQNPVKYIRFFSYFNIVITIDTQSRIEVFDPNTHDFPKNKLLKFKSKIETDYYELQKQKCVCYGFNISNRQKMFVLYSSDRKVRLFDTAKGKIILTFDETIETSIQRQNDQNHPENYQCRIDTQDFDKRLNAEKDIEKQNDQLKVVQMTFDETDQILIYPTFIGIKFVDVNNGQLLRIIGKAEGNQRFMRVSLYQGQSMKNTQNDQQHNSVNRKETDPTIYASSNKSNKFYIFSKRMPEDIGDKSLQVARDILNEPLNQVQQNINIQNESKNKAMSGCQAVIQTTFGEIYINLFPNEAPKTVENFVQHSKNGYYDNMIFHRVQQGFMIQTGCPKGNGTGGESIWGGEFQDEFHPELRHDKPFTVSMANAGPNTNASQFFITVAQCPWLDDKHTIYGRVYKGMDVVMQISEQETDDFDKPLNDIKIITIKIL